MPSPTGAEALKEDQELSASERLGAGLDAFPLVVFVLGGDDTIVDVYAGVSDPKQDVPTTLMGIHFLNIVPSDVATRVRESLVDVRTSKRSVSLEYRLEGARGTRFYEVRLFPLPGERVTAVVSDRSDTRIETAGQRTPGWDLERSLIYSPAVVYSFELGGNVVSLRTVSSNVERILGHSSEVVLSAGWWDRSIHPDDRPAVHHALRELVQQGHDVLEYRLRDAQGHYRWIRQEQVYEDRGRSGSGVVVGSWIDITVEYEQRMALREREARLQTIVDTEPECVKLVAPDGSLIDMNPAGLRMLEAHSLEEVQQQTLIEYVTPEHRAAFVALSRHVFAGGEGTLVFEVFLHGQLT